MLAHTHTHTAYEPTERFWRGAQEADGGDGPQKGGSVGDKGGSKLVLHLWDSVPWTCVTDSDPETQHGLYVEGDSPGRICQEE